MSEYNAGHTDRLAAERRDIDSHWESFHDKMARFRTMEAWSPPPMSDLGKQLFQVCQPSPQELDAIAKMEKDLLAKLERADKIDRLREELRQKAEELRALADSPNEPLTDPELDRMLADLAHDREFESRSYPQRPNPHDE